MRVTNALARANRLAPHATGAIEPERSLTWREIANHVACMARALANMGAGPDAKIAILANNGISYFISWFAVPWCGAVIVPLNTRLVQAELEFQLRDAGVAVLLHDTDFADQAAELLAAGCIAQTLSIDQSFSDLEPLQEHGGEGQLAGIFYTGGTTGMPKGVMLSHGNLTAMAMNLLVHLDFSPGDVIFHAAPMFHLADIGTLFGTIAGGVHVFRKTLEPASMIEDFAAHGVTHCFTVPVMIERLMAEAESRDLDLSGLRYLGYGGSPMSAASLEKARARFPEVSFIQGYGQTEFPAATFLSPQDHASDADPELLRSCGRACVGYDIRIVDEDGEEIPRGELGEIVGRGDNVMMGYLGRGDETETVLKDGWIHTGDAGWMNEDGYIFITDRLKDMIVTGAENVYSIEVENALSYHPAVLECAVVGIPDPKWGERVHAIIVHGEAVEMPDAKKLRDHCRDRIANYKIPKTFTFRTTPLPRSAPGKVLKRELRKAYIEEGGT